MCSVKPETFLIESRAAGLLDEWELTSRAYSELVAGLLVSKPRGATELHGMDFEAGFQQKVLNAFERFGLFSLLVEVEVDRLQGLGAEGGINVLLADGLGAE